MIIARSLVRALEEAGHRAEIVITPQNRFGRQAAAYLATWLTDLGMTEGGTIDQVISLRYPSYAVRHPNHVCWLNHTMREYYDLWGRFSGGLSPQGRLKESVRRRLIHTADRYLLTRNVRKLYTISGTVRGRLSMWPALNATVLYPPARPHHPDVRRQGMGVSHRAHRDRRRHGRPARRRRDPCSLCARLRRGVLYRLASDVGATKIALGHHLDDFIETLLLNLFFAGALEAMPARLVSDNGRHVVVRPLVAVTEAEARAYAKGARTAHRRLLLPGVRRFGPAAAAGQAPHRGTRGRAPRGEELDDPRARQRGHPPSPGYPSQPAPRTAGGGGRVGSGAAAPRASVVNAAVRLASGLAGPAVHGRPADS
jgi:hypothetical protein